jgi:23S rRNA pseudouridine2604 synthase
MVDAAAAGERLAKRVATLRGCSRADAERLIEGGWVQINGVVADDPARRVQQETITIAPNAQAEHLQPLTLLWHKPVGVALAADQPLAGLLPPSQDLRPWHLKHLRCLSPMPAASSGLAVFAQSPGVMRVLQEDGPLLEHEWMLDLASAVVPEQLQTLDKQKVDLAWGPRTPTLKLSVSSQSAERTRLRLAIKTYTPQQLPAWLQHAGLKTTALHRLRLGRVALGALAVGAWRALGPHERF